MKPLSVVIGVLLFLLSGPAVAAQSIRFAEDFRYFWQTINDNYAYFGKKQTDWSRVREIYSEESKRVESREQFIRLLEVVFRELYDNHAQLNTNLADSSRLVPSGADIWAEWKNNKAVITDLRRGFGAERSGMRVGMEIVSINGKPIGDAINPFIGKSLRQSDPAARNWALLATLAGDHRTDRVIEARSFDRTVRTFRPDEPVSMLENVSFPSLLESRLLPRRIGYIKINNSLGDNDLIGAFDREVLRFKDSEGLVIDLRETPSGGNSLVARGIMSRFVTKEQIFQKHVIPAEERDTGVKRSWFEIVSPRGEIYRKPIVVLVGHWTGSMGEGIAVGFDGMKRAVVIGSRMAGLNGAMGTFELPDSKIRFSFPTEQIFHINGSPREDFVPAVVIANSDPDRDLAFDAAIRSILERKGRQK